MDASDGRFRDDRGRTVILRGANLGGDSKIPRTRDGGPASIGEFYDYARASFVGRPFPEDEARDHFARLSRMGLNAARFLVTWEALEGKAPGAYDLEYVDYVERMVSVAGEAGVLLFIDPHQDAWSRWSGGDGAPAWTLELAGFDIRSLHAAGAAIVREEHGDPFPHTIWFTNYNRLACATMFTLFFAGDAFAPTLRIDGMDARSFLQGRYLAAIGLLAGRLSRYDNVIGFGSLNEPSAGFIGQADLRKLEFALSRSGPMPSPLEAMTAGAGIPVSVDRYGIKGFGQGVIGKEVIGSPGARAWKEGRDCVWRREGVWTSGEGGSVALKSGHFASIGGRPVEFGRDFLSPFARRFGEAISSAGGRRRYLLFMEGVPNSSRPAWTASDTDATGVRGVASASHWYDGVTLMFKRWTRCWVGYDPEAGRIALGPRAVRAYFRDHIRRWIDRGRDDMGGAPTVIGEFGIPFDMNGGRAFRTGDYSRQEESLAENYDALDANLASSAIWNYSASNTHARGDDWNGEDLSVFCADEASAGRTETGDPRDAGLRAVRGWARPYARAVAGIPESMGFRTRDGRFSLAFVPDGTVDAPTEIVAPFAQYVAEPGVEALGCEASTEKADGYWLVLARSLPGAARCSVILRRRKGRRPGA